MNNTNLQPSTPTRQAIDLSRPMRTVGQGLNVQLVAFVPSLKMPIIGVIAGDNEVTSWDRDGLYTDDWHSSLNIENYEVA